MALAVALASQCGSHTRSAASPHGNCCRLAPPASPKHPRYVARLAEVAGPLTCSTNHGSTTIWVEPVERRVTALHELPEVPRNGALHRRTHCRPPSRPQDQPPVRALVTRPHSRPAAAGFLAMETSVSDCVRVYAEENNGGDVAALAEGVRGVVHKRLSPMRQLPRRQHSAALRITHTRTSAPAVHGAERAFVRDSRHELRGSRTVNSPDAARAR